MKKIGLFFGSFNPPHIGHALIALNVIEQKLVDEVCFIVSPNNPFKKPESLDTFKHRLDYVKLLTLELGEKFYASSIENDMPVPSFTCDTLKRMVTENPDIEFSIIMGFDNLEKITEWKDFNYIVYNFEIIYYNRMGHFKMPECPFKKVTEIKGEIINISSTDIRKKLKNKQTVQYLIPQTVLRLIKRFHSYE